MPDINDEVPTASGRPVGPPVPAKVQLDPDDIMGTGTGSHIDEKPVSGDDTE